MLEMETKKKKTKSPIALQDFTDNSVLGYFVNSNH